MPKNRKLPFASGFYAVPDVVWNWPGITNDRRCLFAYLDKFQRLPSNRFGVAYKSLRTAAAELGMGKDTVARGIAWLAGQGLVSKGSKRTPNGHVSTYRINWDTINGKIARGRLSQAGTRLSQCRDEAVSVQGQGVSLQVRARPCTETACLTTGADRDNSKKNEKETCCSSRPVAGGAAAPAATGLNQAQPQQHSTYSTSLSNETEREGLERAILASGRLPKPEGDVVALGQNGASSGTDANAPSLIEERATMNAKHSSLKTVVEECGSRAAAPAPVPSASAVSAAAKLRAYAGNLFGQDILPAGAEGIVAEQLSKAAVSQEDVLRGAMCALDIYKDESKGRPAYLTDGFFRQIIARRILSKCAKLGAVKDEKAAALNEKAEMLDKAFSDLKAAEETANDRAFAFAMVEHGYALAAQFLHEEHGLTDSECRQRIIAVMALFIRSSSSAANAVEHLRLGTRRTASLKFLLYEDSIWHECEEKTRDLVDVALQQSGVAA